MLHSCKRGEGEVMAGRDEGRERRREGKEDEREKNKGKRNGEANIHYSRWSIKQDEKE